MKMFLALASLCAACSDVGIDEQYAGALDVLAGGSWIACVGPGDSGLRPNDGPQMIDFIVAIRCEDGIALGAACEYVRLAVDGTNGIDAYFLQDEFTSDCSIRWTEPIFECGGPKMTLEMTSEGTYLGSLFQPCDQWIAPVDVR